MMTFIYLLSYLSMHRCSYFVEKPRPHPLRSNLVQVSCGKKDICIDLLEKLKWHFQFLFYTLAIQCTRPHPMSMHTVYVWTKFSVTLTCQNRLVKSSCGYTSYFMHFILSFAFSKCRFSAFKLTLSNCLFKPVTTCFTSSKIESSPPPYALFISERASAWGRLVETPYPTPCGFTSYTSTQRHSKLIQDLNCTKYAATVLTDLKKLRIFYSEYKTCLP